MGENEVSGGIQKTGYFLGLDLRVDESGGMTVFRSAELCAPAFLRLVAA